MDHLTGAALLVVSAAFITAYRLLIKTSSDRVALLAGTNGISAVVGLAGVWFVPPPSLGAFAYLGASSLAYVAAMIFLSRGYRHADFARITPLYPAIRTLVIAFLMVGVFGEAAGPEHWLAVALIALAFVVQAGPSNLLARGHLATLLFAVGIGCASGLQYVFDTGGVRHVEVPWTYIVWNLFIGLPIVAYGLISRPRSIARQFQEQARGILAGSLLDILSYAMILFVVHFLAVIDILPLINLYMLFSALIGVLWLREPNPGRNIAAATMLLVAVFTVEWF